MISKEQVADLLPGDIVELRDDDWPESHWIRAMLKIDRAGYLVMPAPGDSGSSYWIRDPQGGVFGGENLTLRVISRVPRPLYVNHDRTEPEQGDVVRDAYDPTSNQLWVNDGASDNAWMNLRDYTAWNRGDMPTHLRLLVDGKTGQAVTR